MPPESLVKAVATPAYSGDWLALRGCRLSGHRIPLVLLHPWIGVAIVGGPPDGPALFRQRLDRARFFSIFSGELPIVRLGSEDEPPEPAFAGLPPLSLPGEDAWILAARRALEMEAPQGQPALPGIRSRRRRRRRRLIMLAGAAAVIAGAIGIGVAILPGVPAPLPIASHVPSPPGPPPAVDARPLAAPVVPGPVAVAPPPARVAPPPATSGVVAPPLPPVPRPPPAVAGLPPAPTTMPGPPAPPAKAVASAAAEPPPRAARLAQGIPARGSEAGPASARCRQIIQRMQIGDLVPDADIRFLRRGCPG